MPPTAQPAFYATQDNQPRVVPSLIKKMPPQTCLQVNKQNKTNKNKQKQQRRERKNESQIEADRRNNDPGLWLCLVSAPNPLLC